jgi:hypothetical protein
MPSQEVVTAFVMIAEVIQSRDLTDEQLARLINDDPQVRPSFCKPSGLHRLALKIRRVADGGLSAV